VDEVRGVLLDIDGVLVTSWRPLPGAADSLSALRRAGLSLRFLTNTTAKSGREIVVALNEVGVAIDADELITAGRITADYLTSRFPGARCLVLNDGSDEDMDRAGVVRTDDTDAEVVVIGSGGPSFSWERLNVALRCLTRGAALVAMHGSKSWMTDQGPCLDAGAYVSMLVAAAGGVSPVTIGKPAPAMFDAAIESMRMDPRHLVMVGDDVQNDVLAAGSVGVRGILVRTGKFRPQADRLARTNSIAVIDSIADLPAAIGF